MGLDTVDLVMAVEDQFELEIPDAVAEMMGSVGDMHALLVSELKRLGRQGDSEGIVERMRAIIVRQLDVSPERVLISARFGKALHVD